jgi:predicted ATPase
MVARNVECETHCWMGNFLRARDAADRGLRAYDPDKHGHLVHVYNHDQKCGILAWAVHFLWILGYPDQAQQAAEAQVEQARRLGHPFNLCFSLTQGSMALIQRGQTQIARQWIAEANHIGKDNALSYVTGFFVPLFDSYALIQQGDHAGGYDKLVHALKPWVHAGGLLLGPYNKMMEATAAMGLHRFDEARRLLTDAIELVNQSDHRMHEAEVHRVYGELYNRQPERDLQSAEASFLKAIEVARFQDAKGWELRAALGLARLWQGEGKRKQAHDLLAPIYSWFTEGFDTKDLKEAQVLLRDLA